MRNPFFERPILNSPYEYPLQHWELDEAGQPTQRIIETRRKAEFITPIPKPRKQKGKPKQQRLDLDDTGLSSVHQQYEKTATVINELRAHVDRWRELRRSQRLARQPRNRRFGPRRGLQHRTPPAVRSLHPRPRLPLGQRRRPGIGVPENLGGEPHPKGSRQNGAESCDHEASEQLRVLDGIT